MAYSLVVHLSGVWEVRILGTFPHIHILHIWHAGVAIKVHRWTCSDA